MKSHWSKLFFPIFFVIILFMALVKYISFHTTFWDLGWQDYIVYNIVPGQSWQFLFRGHAHIFSLFYSFLYKFLPCFAYNLSNSGHCFDILAVLSIWNIIVKTVRHLYEKVSKIWYSSSTFILIVSVL